MDLPLISFGLKIQKAIANQKTNFRMKKIFLALSFLLCSMQFLWAQEIHWMSLDDAQVAMKKQPKKVYIDVYTDWCGWCKKMDKTTFQNPEVVKYINDNFYAVRFNAEIREDIMFRGKMYGFNTDKKANQLMVELMREQMSYPTMIFMEENFQNPMPVPGYMDVATMEKVLKYLNGGLYKTVQYPQYEKEFTPTWK
jgi:thioredoxin-related protein